MSTVSKSMRTKLPDLPESIFTTMSVMAKDQNAINLSQGFPNFEPDPRLIELAAKAMRDGYNQYAPLGGIYPLRATISEKIHKLYGREYHPQTEITVTAGATQAIYTSIAAFIWPGDEVIVLKPAYDCYEPSIEAQGGKPVLVQMRLKDYSVDWEVFKEAISAKTRMVIINTPHNPSGRTFSRKDMEEAQLRRRKQRGTLLRLGICPFWNTD